MNASTEQARHDYTIRSHHGRQTLFYNDQPRPWVMYHPGDAHGNVAREDVDRFLEAGVGDFYLMVTRHEQGKELGDYLLTPFLSGIDDLGEPKFVSPERFYSLPERVAYIIQRNPDARFLIRYFAHMPKAWGAAYPEELSVDDTGQRLGETSLASKRYEEDHRRFLLHMVRWIEAQPWAWRVIGYISLHESEGTTYSAIKGLTFDYSEPMQRAFREFAPEWDGVPKNRFAAEREGGAAAHWPDPAMTKCERDYFELVRQLFLRRCRLFVETVQEALNGRKVLIGMDALKQGMQGWICDPFFFGRPPRAHHSHILLASGSIGADEFFQIPGFNVLNTPYDYIFRHMGGAPEPEGIVDSFVLRGKLFLGEDDCRSFTCSEREAYGFYRNLEEVKAGIFRNVADAIARGYQRYWMDVTSFPSPKGGYFRDPGIMEVIKSAVPVIRASVNLPHEDVPGIAVIIDDRSGLDEDFSANFQNLAVMWQRLTGLAKAGVPYRVYLWGDLLSENFPEHRLFLFPNLFRMNEERLEILRRRVFGKGRVVLWGPGTGITDGCQLGTEWATRVTGMPMTLFHENYARRVVLTRHDHPITENLRGSIAYGDSTCYGPILLPEFDPTVSEQGIVLTSRGINRPGLAIKEMGKDEGRWTSVFTAAVPVPADLIREMARHAGAHIYSEENDVIMASRRFLAVHSVRGGKRTIRLPQISEVRDAISGELISAATDGIELEVTPPQTRLFMINPHGESRR